MPRQRRAARRSGFVALVVSTVLGLAACTSAGDDGATSPALVTPAPPDGSSPSAGAGTSAASDDATAADLEFLAAMLVHHEQAVELAGLAGGRTGDEELADLASRMGVTQAAEADAMRSWLEKRQSDDRGATGHGHDVAMRGEISRSTLERPPSSTDRHSMRCSSPRWWPTIAAPSRWPRPASPRPEIRPSPGGRAPSPPRSLPEIDRMARTRGPAPSRLRERAPER